MNSAAVRLNQMPDDRESQAKTSMHSRAGRIRLPELVKDVREKLRLNPDTAVDDTHFGMPVAFKKFDVDFSVLWRELDGVGEKIPEHLLQSIRVPGYRADIVMKPCFDLNAFGFACRPNRFHSGL